MNLLQPASAAFHSGEFLRGAENAVKDLIIG